MNQSWPGAVGRANEALLDFDFERHINSPTCFARRGIKGTQVKHKLNARANSHYKEQKNYGAREFKGQQT